MEKYTKFRDRGSGVAPFIPIAQGTSAYLPLRILLFSLRFPLVTSISLTYFFFLQWLPLGALVRKAILWMLLGIPGIWWVDLQIDGVRRGSLGQNLRRLPQGGTIIAATLTSPLDALYLGAVFDAVFTISYPGTYLVEQTTLLGVILHAFSNPRLKPPAGSRLVEVGKILEMYPLRPVAVFPECTTTNGRGVLRLSSCLLSVPLGTKVFPVSLRYSAGDITTPIPHTYARFIWQLLSAPTHSLRVRIAEAVPAPNPLRQLASIADADMASSLKRETNVAAGVSEDMRILDTIGEHLARLGRVKYLGLSAADKYEFLKVWRDQRH